MFKNEKDGKRHYKNTNWHKTMEKNVSMNTSKKISSTNKVLGASKSHKNIENNNSGKIKVSDGAVLNDVPKKGE
jgi:hypothetical protein